jgi:hypothetical protein
MRRFVLTWLLSATATAQARSPADFSVSGLSHFNGQAVQDPVLLTEAYNNLVRDLGVAIAIGAVLPARTPGSSGFDVSFGNSFVVLPGIEADTPSHWQRATGGEDHGTLLTLPSLTARKGLPLSMEVGTTVGWLAGGQSGLFGGFFRAAIVEGYKPWPDLTVHLGYSGLVGHSELDLGVVDVGLTLGSSYPFGSIPDLREAQVSPWIDLSLVTVLSQVRLDEETKSSLFGPAEEDAETDTRGQSRSQKLPRLGGGLQITNGTVLFRLAGSWSPKTLPAIFIGLGASY